MARESSFEAMSSKLLLAAALSVLALHEFFSDLRSEICY